MRLIEIVDRFVAFFKGKSKKSLILDIDDYDFLYAVAQSHYYNLCMTKNVKPCEDPETWQVTDLCNRTWTFHGPARSKGDYNDPEHVFIWVASDSKYSLERIENYPKGYLYPVVTSFDSEILGIRGTKFKIKVDK